MSSSGRKYYVKNAVVSIEEDEFNEFKGHRSLGIEDLPPWCFKPGSDRRTRKPASGALNAFLNSGRGGTVYLGIIDQGIVKGIYLTEFQKDHIKVAIKDLFSRYKPIVEDNMYDVVFVPILGKDGNIGDVVKKDVAIKAEDIEMHLKPHLLRTYDFCWCDKDLARRIDDNERPQDYIVEVRIRSQKTTFDVFGDGSFKAVLPVTYQNEEGLCFFRASASCKEYSVTQCQQLALQQLKDLYDPVVTTMRNKLEIAR